MLQMLKSVVQSLWYEQIKQEPQADAHSTPYSTYCSLSSNLVYILGLW